MTPLDWQNRRSHFDNINLMAGNEKGIGNGID